MLCSITPGPLKPPSSNDADGGDSIDGTLQTINGNTKGIPETWQSTPQFEGKAESLHLVVNPSASQLEQQKLSQSLLTIERSFPPVDALVPHHLQDYSRPGSLMTTDHFIYQPTPQTSLSFQPHYPSQFQSSQPRPDPISSVQISTVGQSQNRNAYEQTAHPSRMQPQFPLLQAQPRSFFEPSLESHQRLAQPPVSTKSYRPCHSVR